jgi:predicted ArsR family transcriptional regulator
MPLIEKRAVAVMRAISSTSRLQVIELIGLGHDHPDDLASKMETTRQAIDKHLTMLSSVGLVERHAVFSPSGRARVAYRLTDGTRELIEEVGRKFGAHAARIQATCLEAREALDRDLAQGRLDRESHARKVADLKRQFAFFLPDE